MKLVLHDGTIHEVDTNHICNNQYNTLDGKRIFDSEVKYIIDDIRLGEFYCSSVKQGTYEEVAQAIAEERSKINQCEDCWWFHQLTRIKDECQREEVREGNRKVINEKTVYEISCAHSNGCVHDIDDKPILFRERQFCFFCEYPQGIPDMKPLKQFMVDNAEKYGIVPYWSDGKLDMYHRLKHDKLFGSYKFETGPDSNYFELSNARNSFSFYVDVVNKRFILIDSIGYEVVDKLTQHRCEYDYETKQHKSYDEPIKNYDKFATWLWQIVDDFNAQKEVNKQ